MTNPVVFSESGSSMQTGRVQSILWTGATSLDDQVVVEHIGGGILFKGIASGDQTHRGISFGANGIAIKSGVNASRIDSGTLLIYFLEN